MSTHAVPEGIAVSLQLLKAPIVGENISFNVIITNKGDVPKMLRKHVNAQNKEYNCNPSEAFWKAENDLEIGPYESKSSATYTDPQKLLKMSLKCSLLITRNFNLQMFLKIL